MNNILYHLSSVDLAIVFGVNYIIISEIHKKDCIEMHSKILLQWMNFCEVFDPNYNFTALIDISKTACRLSPT